MPLTGEKAADPSLSLGQQAVAAIGKRPGGSDALHSLKDKNPWVSFQFKNQMNGQILTLAKPVSE